MENFSLQNDTKISDWDYDVSELQIHVANIIKEKLGTDLDVQIDFDGTTYTIDNDAIFLTFKIESERFTILKIEALTKGFGIGTTTINAIHQFAEERDLEVWASKVEDDARSYWEGILNYQESEELGEYYYPY